jgi:hypothetical protein
MSVELSSKYSNLFKFIEAIKTFEKIYEENQNPEIDFTNFLLKITIIDNFISTVFEKVDFQTSLEIVKKIKLDPAFMTKIIDNTVSENNLRTFETLEKPAIDSDHSSVSSIEDINSNNSEISDQEDDGRKELSIQTKKMLASSLVELNIRKKDKDYNTIKVEEED